MVDTTINTHKAIDSIIMVANASIAVEKSSVQITIVKPEEPSPLNPLNIIFLQKNIMPIVKSSAHHYEQSSDRKQKLELQGF